MHLPESRTGRTEKTQDLLVVNVLAKDAAAAPIEVEGIHIEPDLLTQLIRERRAEKPDTVIQIRADRDLAYADVIPVIRACRLAGVRDIRISAEQTY